MSAVALMQHMMLTKQDVYEVFTPEETNANMQSTHIWRNIKDKVKIDGLIS